MSKDKKTMDEKVTELTNQLLEEEEKTKQITKQKNKYEAIIADLEERLRREQGGELL